MADDDQRLSNRLMGRAGGLARRQMPGGGEAFSGPTASQALKALGARAFTMDQQVFVDEGFDSGNPEDLALYAHEKHHQSESGGMDDHSDYDGEEQAARAQERLVLHRANAGHDADDILADASSGEAPSTADQADDAFAAMEGRGGSDDGGNPEPMAAVRGMLKDGKSHHQIVRELAEHVVQTLQRQGEEMNVRTAADGE